MCSRAVNMWITVFLSVLPMLGGLEVAAASDLRVYGKSVYSDESLLSSNDGKRNVRTQPHRQLKSEISRSLDFDSFTKHVATPTIHKISLPSIIKLYPPTAKPLHLHANMPMRFGRQTYPGEERSPNSPNMPQRFGRSREVTHMCAECPGVQKAPDQMQTLRLGRDTLYRSFLRTLANARILNTGFHWAEDLDFTTNREEAEVQEKIFKGERIT